MGEFADFFAVGFPNIYLNVYRKSFFHEKTWLLPGLCLGGVFRDRQCTTEPQITAVIGRVVLLTIGCP